jgi:hypothetical protein
MDLVDDIQQHHIKGALVRTITASIRQRLPDGAGAALVATLDTP